MGRRGLSDICDSVGFSDVEDRAGHRAVSIGRKAKNREQRQQARDFPYFAYLGSHGMALSRDYEDSAAIMTIALPTMTGAGQIR